MWSVKWSAYNRLFYVLYKLYGNHKAKTHTRYVKDKEKESKCTIIKKSLSKEDSERWRMEQQIYKTPRTVNEMALVNLTDNNYSKLKWIKLSNQTTLGGWMNKKARPNYLLHTINSLQL